MSVPFQSWQGTIVSPNRSRMTGRRGPAWGEPEVYPPARPHYPYKDGRPKSARPDPFSQKYPDRSKYGAAENENEGPFRGSIDYPGGKLTYDGDLVGMGIFFGIATIGLMRELARKG